VILVEGGLGPAKIYALIGDGSRDRRVLRAAAEKYDHRKIIRVPDRPCRGLMEKGPAPAIRMLAYLLAETPVTAYIILMDREHVSKPGEIERMMRQHGFSLSESRDLGRGCWRLLVKRGGKSVAVYVVLLGHTKSIEKNLAQLIQLLYGEPVKGEKEDIKRWFKENGEKHRVEKDENLVRKAPKKDFEKAFPQLAKALEELEKDPESPDKDCSTITVKKSLAGMEKL